MPMYDSYLDEDIDLDVSLAEYLDDEGLAESDDYDEAKPRRRRGRAGRRLNRMASARNRQVRSTAPVNTSTIRNAFRGVGEDVTVLERKLQRTQKAETNQNLLEALSLLLSGAKPINTTLATPIPIINPDGSKGEIKQIVTGVNNNLLIPLAIKLFAGNRSGHNTQQLLIVGLGIVLLFPD